MKIVEQLQEYCSIKGFLSNAGESQVSNIEMV